MDLLDSAIQKTIEYGRRFGVEYGAKEIEKRLISNTMFTTNEISAKLNGKGSRVLNDFDKVEKARVLAELIGKHFKDILMIGVTGSVAAGYPKKQDDIDLMIVTKKNRLWLTRLMLRIFIYINKIPHRKYNERENRDDFCFNLWLEEDVMELPADRKTLQNAMDSILMIPVLNRNLTYEKFMKNNSWIKNFLANAYAKFT